MDVTADATTIEALRKAYREGALLQRSMIQAEQAQRAAPREPVSGGNQMRPPAHQSSQPVASEARSISGVAVRNVMPGGYAADSRFEELLGFLRTVLPVDGPVYFAVTLHIRGSDRPPRHDACRSLEELATRLLALDKGTGEVYFATASYRHEWWNASEKAKAQQRVRENVAAVRSCWLDIDVGPQKAASGDGYDTQPNALAALNAFSTRLGIAPTFVVSSGRGIHAYWAFTQSVTPAQWVHAAKSLKHACSLTGLRADGACTADMTRILRPLRCTWRKDSTDVRSVARLARGEPIEFDAFVRAVEQLRGTARRIAGSVGATEDRAFVLNTLGVPRLTTVSINDDLTAGLYQTPRPLAGLSEDDQLRVLDDACAAIPDIEWSRYEFWMTVIAAVRGLRHLDETKRLALLEKHSARSPKWATDHWTTARLLEKFRSSEGGSPARIFELAEAHGWQPAEPAMPAALRPFEDREAAERYLTARFIHVADQNGYLDVDNHLLITPATLDEAHSWLTQNLRTKPRQVLMMSRDTRRAGSLGYHPGAGAVYEENGRLLANQYVPYAPVSLEPTPAELALWNWFINEHLFRRTCDKAARDYFLNALAYPLQNPGRRVASVPLLIGEQYGSGKSTLMERVPRLVCGDRNVTIATQSEIESAFNDWHANAQIVCFPEIWLGSARDAERVANDLKDKITSDLLRVYPKGRKGYSQVNRATLLGTSNHENAVYLREGDRRWGVHITDAPKMTEAQSQELYSFLNSERAPSVLRHMLLTRNLSAFNPAGEPPMTVGKRRVIEASVHH